MPLQDNIKKIREEKGLLQKDVYTFLGMAKSVYSKIENGGRDISAQELIAIAQLFNMSIDDIVGYNVTSPTTKKGDEKAAPEVDKLLKELNEEDRQLIYTLTDKLLTVKEYNQLLKKSKKVKKK